MSIITPNRLDSLTGVRLLLALLVLLCHGFIRCSILPEGHWGMKIINEMGHCGVAGFFVLSGYILTHVYRDREWATTEFVVNRVARIYPLYLIGILFTFPMDWLSPGMSTEDRIPALGLSVILQQSWAPFSNGRFNGPGWTLSVETLFYALFPLLFYFWRHRPWLFKIMLVSAVAITAFFWDPQSFYQSHRFPLMRVWEFMVGMALAMIPFHRCFVRSEWLAILLVIASPAVAAALSFPDYPFVKWLAMIILSALTILILAARDTALSDSNKMEVKSLLRWKWFVIGGEVSYGLYLLHDGVQRYCRVVFEKLFHVLLKDSSLALKISYLLVTSVASLLLAWLLWSLVEIPARKFLRNKLTSSAR
jgi:peptidoglycan/LPS O-acetylase OafA/YrhL